MFVNAKCTIVLLVAKYMIKLGKVFIRRICEWLAFYGDQILCRPSLERVACRLCSMKLLSTSHYMSVWLTLWLSNVHNPLRLFLYFVHIVRLCVYITCLMDLIKTQLLYCMLIRITLHFPSVFSYMKIFLWIAMFICTGFSNYSHCVSNGVTNV